MIRDATLDDLPAMIRMGREFFAISGWQNVTSFDEDSFGKTMARLMQSPEGVVKVDDGEAMAAAVLFPTYINLEHLCCQELFYWSDTPGKGLPLLKAMEQEAIRRGAASFLASATIGLRHETLHALYERGGYFPVDNQYLRQL